MMEKNNIFSKINKKYIFYLMLILVFLFFVIFYYKNTIDHQNTMTQTAAVYENQVTKIENQEYVETGDQYHQKIYLDNNSYNGINVNLNYDQISGDTLINVKIFDEDIILGENSFNSSNIRTGYNKIILPVTFDVEESQSIDLYVNCINVNPKDNISFSMINENNNNLNLLSKNDEIIPNQSLDVTYDYIVSDYTTKPIFVFFVVISLIILIVSCYCCQNFKKFNFEKSFLILFPIVCITYMFLFPPQTAPDEQIHFDSAYQYSNIMMFNGDQRLEKRTCDLVIDDNVLVTKNHYKEVLNKFSLKCDNNTMVPVEDRLGTSAPFAYIPSAIGITIARLLGLGTIPLYWMGRLFNILFCYVLFYFALKLIPFGKSVLFSVFMLPMVSHLVASYSYDGFIIALSFLLAALILKMAYKDEKIKKKDVGLAIILSAVLAPCKIVYASISCLSLLISKRKMGKYRWLPQILIIGTAVLSVLIFQTASVQNVSTESLVVPWSGTPAYTLSWSLDNPLNAIMIFVNTLLTFGWKFITQAIGISLGWLRIEIPWFVVVGFIIILALAMMDKTDDEYKISLPVRLWSLILFLGSSFLIMYSMYSSHTPIGYITIMGVQGRYFIPLIPLFYLIIKNKVITINNIDSYLVALTGFFEGLAIITAFVSIVVAVI